MTKKNYIEAARLISQDYRHDPEVREQVIRTFVVFFRNDNPRFNEQIFRNAAAPSE